MVAACGVGPPTLSVAPLPQVLVRPLALPFACQADAAGTCRAACARDFGNRVAARTFVLVCVPGCHVGPTFSGTTLQSQKECTEP